MDNTGYIKGDEALTKVAFEIHQRLQPFLSEFFDDWMLVGRCPNRGRVLIGENDFHEKWSDMQALYDEAKKWQSRKKTKENSVGDNS